MFKIYKKKLKQMFQNWLLILLLAMPTYTQNMKKVDDKQFISFSGFIEAKR